MKHDTDTLHEDHPHLVKPEKPYRGPGGQRLTKSLFYEMWRETEVGLRTYLPVFTLHYDRPGLVNFGKHYIASEDPTGYTTAKELLGDYQTWELLLRSGWFKQSKAVWDKEMDAALRSKALRNIVRMAEADDPKGLQAAKFLANLEYKDSKGSRRGAGRPSKEEVAQALNEEKDAQKQLQADLDRIKNIHAV